MGEGGKGGEGFLTLGGGWKNLQISLASSKFALIIASPSLLLRPKFGDILMCLLSVTSHFQSIRGSWNPYSQNTPRTQVHFTTSNFFPVASHHLLWPGGLLWPRNRSLSSTLAAQQSKTTAHADRILPFFCSQTCHDPPFPSELKCLSRLTMSNLTWYFFHLWPSLPYFFLPHLLSCSHTSLLADVQAHQVDMHLKSLLYEMLFPPSNHKPTP